jgi:hypothetical protein
LGISVRQESLDWLEGIPNGLIMPEITPANKQFNESISADYGNTIIEGIHLA